MLLCGASIMFHHSEAPQRGVKIKRLCYFSRLIPDLDDKGLDCVCAKLPTCAISVSLTAKMHKKISPPPELLTSRTTLLLHETGHCKGYCQIPQTFFREIVPDNTSFCLRCEIILDLY